VLLNKYNDAVSLNVDMLETLFLSFFQRRRGALSLAVPKDEFISLCSLHHWKKCQKGTKWEKSFLGTAIRVLNIEMKRNYRRYVT